MNLSMIAFLFYLLFCGIVVHGSEDGLQRAMIAVDKLWEPVDVLWRNVQGERNSFSSQIETILENFIIIEGEINGLSLVPAQSGSEFKRFIYHQINGLDVFDIIMKLLYTQSDRSRYDFTSPGGPNLRMYSFGIIGRICSRFGPIDNPNEMYERKAYLYPKLKVNNPPGGFYANIAETEMKNVDEGALDDYTVDLPGPFFDAIDTIEGQLYNFYQQWNSKKDYARLTWGNVFVMNAVLQNMLVALDYIMSADDTITQGSVPSQGEELANYIYFFENNRVYDLLESIASRTDGDYAIQNIVAYANFLLDTYFIGFDGEMPYLHNRLAIQVYNLNRFTVFQGGNKRKSYK